MTNQTLIAEFANGNNAYGTASKMVKLLGEQTAYNLATTLLAVLADKHYCIWQTYDKEDIKLNTGKKKISNNYLDELQDRLQNTFANDYLTD